MPKHEASRSGAVPIVRCVLDAYAALWTHWALFLPAAAAVALLALLSALLGSTSGLQLGFNLLGLLVDSAFSAAILRKLMRDEYVRPVGLTLGAPEFRLFAVGLIVSGILLLAALLPTVVFVTRLLANAGLSEVEMEALASDPVAMREALTGAISAADVALSLLLFLPVLWLVGRLFVSAAATFGEGKIAVAEAWRWSSGNGWRIALCLVLAAAPLVLINLVVLGGQVELGAQSPWLLLIILAFVGTGTALLRIPVLALGALLYRGLRPAQ